MIVDFHTHIVPPRIKENRLEYLSRDHCFASLFSNPRARLATADEIISSMDETGVDVSVVLNFGWAEHVLCQETNDYILDSISRYPGRLVGFCSIQPRAGAAAVAEVERCARGGAKGVGELRPDAQGFDLGDKALLSPLIQVMREYNLVLLTHSSEPVGHQYAGKGNVPLDDLYRFLCLFSDIAVVFAHWGGGLPFYSLMPEVARVLDRAFFDTAATPFLYHPTIYKVVSQLVGTEKILFGTDYPLMPQARVIQQIRGLDLDQKSKDDVLGENARGLLRIGSPASPRGETRDGSRGFGVATDL